MRGYIYIIANDSIHNQVKVGYTTRTPEERASDLYQNNSGISHHYKVLYAIAIDEFYLREQYNNQTDRSILQRLEQEIHQELDQWRINQRREWFRVSNGRELNQVVRVIRRLANSYARYEISHNRLADYQFSGAGPASLRQDLQQRLPRLGFFLAQLLPWLGHWRRELLWLFILGLCCYQVSAAAASFAASFYPALLVCGGCWGWRLYQRKGQRLRANDFAELALPAALLLAALLNQVLPRLPLRLALACGLFFFLVPLARRDD